MRLFIVLLLSLGSVYGDTAKVVYDLTTGDSKKIEKHLINSIDAVAKYYKKEKKELKVIVVISGNAYKYFVNDLKASPYNEDQDVIEVQEKFKHRLQNLNDTYGVTFNMCSSGMKARKIDKSTLYKYVHADVMKSVYLIDAQNEGYAYMPIH
jgi:hypothetical protein